MDTDKHDAYLTSVKIRILASLLSRLAGRSFQARFRAAANARLSGQQYGVLRSLSAHQSTLSDLSKGFALDPSTLVPVVDSLARRGLISRERDLDDRRRILLSLTDKGAKLVAKMPLYHEDDVLFQSLQEIGEEKTTSLLNLLREVIVTMPDGEHMVQAIETRLDLSRQGTAPSQMEHGCFPGEPGFHDDSTRREQRRELRSRMRQQFRKRNV